MNILDVLIIMTIIILFCYFYQKNHSIKNNNKTDVVPNDLKLDEHFGIEVKYPFLDNYIDTLLDSNSKHIGENKKIKNNQIINPYFIEMQFHKDYIDTNNVFTILVPGIKQGQKQLFNRSDLPLIKVETPNNKEIIPILKNFINTVNKTLDENINDDMTATNWKSNFTDKVYDDGFEKQQEKLGLPPSIYNKPLKKEHIKLLKLDHSEKYETEDEIRYAIFIIVKKLSAEDQMLVKINFYIDKKDINLDRDFFDVDKDNFSSSIKIEEIFVLGYLTKNSFGKHSVKSQYYNFNGITDGKMFSNKDILKELNMKRKQYQAECIS